VNASFPHLPKLGDLFSEHLTCDNISHQNEHVISFKVGNEHAGDYTCIPYNREGSKGPSDTIQVIIKDPPEFITRPDQVLFLNFRCRIS